MQFFFLNKCTVFLNNHNPFGYKQNCSNGNNFGRAGETGISQVNDRAWWARVFFKQTNFSAVLTAKMDIFYQFQEICKKKYIHSFFEEDSLSDALHQSKGSRVRYFPFNHSKELTQSVFFFVFLRSKSLCPSQRLHHRQFGALLPKVFCMQVINHCKVLTQSVFILCIICKKKADFN